MNFEKGRVLAIKSIRVKEISGSIFLSSHDYTALDLNPTDDAAKTLLAAAVPLNPLTETKENSAFKVLHVFVL